ncbi:MAG: sugar kinase, partial [Leeuwenhoekiella sp.]
MQKMVIVGTCAFDEIESPFGKTGKILGGAGTFIGLAASNFEVDQAIVSVVGSDFPQEYIDLLKNRGINMEGLEVVKDGKTFFWKGRYHNDLNSRDTLITELNTLADFNPVVPEAYRDAEVVVLGNLHPLVQLSVLEQMNQKPKLAILDTMNFWITGQRDELLDVIKLVDALIINDEEVLLLTEQRSMLRAARDLQKQGPSTIIIKRGEHGVLLFHEQDIFCVPAYPLESVVDPTGAGDSFAGGFMGFLADCDGRDG